MESYFGSHSITLTLFVASPNPWIKSSFGLNVCKICFRFEECKPGVERREEPPFDPLA
jgi:hypothetical protein